jgi:hypothetical protein
MKNEIELASRAMYKELRRQGYTVEGAKNIITNELLREADKIDGNNRIYF